MPDHPVRHEPEALRFVVDTPHGEALLDYRTFTGGVILAHTEVPPGAENQGIASALARAALDWARAERLRVTPTCPFVIAYLRRHPEYQDLTRPPAAG